MNGFEWSMVTDTRSVCVFNRMFLGKCLHTIPCRLQVWWGSHLPWVRSHVHGIPSTWGILTVVPGGWQCDESCRTSPWSLPTPGCGFVERDGSSRIRSGMFSRASSNRTAPPGDYDHVFETVILIVSCGAGCRCLLHVMFPEPFDSGNGCSSELSVFNDRGCSLGSRFHSGSRSPCVRIPVCRGSVGHAGSSRCPSSYSLIITIGGGVGMRRPPLWIHDTSITLLTTMVFTW